MGQATVGTKEFEGAGYVAHTAAKRDSLGDQILRAYAALNQAFTEGNAEQVQRLTSPDHVSVTHNGSWRTPVAQRVGNGQLVGFKREIASDVSVEEIAPGVVIQRFEAKMQGTFDGVPIPERAAVTIIWQRQNGTWVERLYQHTALTD